MTDFHPRSSLRDVIAQDDARAIITEIAPEVLASGLAQADTDFPLERVLTVILDPTDPRIPVLLDRLATIEDRTARAEETAPIVPSNDYETSDVEVGSARLEAPANAVANRTLELVFHGPSHGNPFTDVDIRVRFELGDTVTEVGGFYDGDGRHVVRFLPAEAGTWSFRTTSNARSLDGIVATIDVGTSDALGAVRADGMHFAYADGTPYIPVGTTAYAWTHQSESLQQQTLDALADGPFTKIRMCLFPKHFLYNSDEPERFVFPRTDDGWDTTSFDLEYFRHLEGRIRELEELGIQADLILFHPYDRWGFSRLPKSVDDRYVAYVTRRLAALPNVWWSLANEYDLLLRKDVDDWDRIGRLVRDNDPYGHPLSIHNWVDLWDYDSAWATHCSIQNGDGLGGKTREWRRRWNKPVLVDECGYEGDLDQGWGSLTAEEEVRRFWDVTLGGGYATHGETYYSTDDVIFWSKGGALRGESPERLAFLRALIDESPTGRLEPLPSDFDASYAGVDGQYVLIYFGIGRPAFRHVSIPAGMRARVDVIDTWEMTVTSVPGVHEGDIRIDLPARPYCAIRLTAAE